MSEPAKLTKKQKKAQAFRSAKGKGKHADEDLADVPEDENLDEAEEAPVVKEKTSKKRKLGDATEGEEVSAVEEGEGERKKKRQRGKKKSARNNAVGEDGKPRLLLFAGNLPYKVTVETIQQHFAGCGETPVVRLLTPKPNPNSTVAKSKGCAFLEFTLATALQSALRLHQSDLAGRKINVELTAGGGGNSEARKTKIIENRKRMELEREKAAANRKKREGEPENKDKSARWAKKEEEPVKSTVEVTKEKGMGKSGKKVRDRRIPKVNAEGHVKERARKEEAKRSAAMSGANSVALGK